MTLWDKAIKKLLLVKEIKSKEGIVHFRRFRLLSSPWYNIYIHQICQSDLDVHPHSHPWSFYSLILEGAYKETVSLAPLFEDEQVFYYYTGDIIERRAEDFHKIKLISTEVWTLVITSAHEKEWGYRLNDGSFIDHKTYRQLKNEGKL